MTELAFDIASLHQAYAKGLTPVEMIELVLARIAAVKDPGIFIHLPGKATLLATAATLGTYDPSKPLWGIPFAVKDNIDVAGMPTTAGMATRSDRIAMQDAFVVRRLRAAGMVLLGKTNMHEAALGATNANPHYGNCENPGREGSTPGGSSGGSAAAVAAGLCALALGTDTMGSVRIPAAYCGVVGFKASWGRVSTGGTVPCCFALDHVGPLLRSRRDLNLVMPVLACYDPECADARKIPVLPARRRPRLLAAADIEALGVTSQVTRAYRGALLALRERGERLVELELAGYDFGRARRAGLLAVEADLLVVHGEDWRDQREHFSPELTRMLARAEPQGVAMLAAALRTMAAAHVEAARWWAQGDVMLLPCAPQQAFAFDEHVPVNQADLTAIANMAGLPAISAPLPVPAGDLPIGLQAIAPYGAEATLLALDLDGVCTA